MAYKLNNKKQLGLLFFFVFMLMQGATISCQTVKKTKNMKNIEFIPQEFNIVKLGFYETSETVSFLQFSEGIPMNTITISTPQKIICNTNDKYFVPVIPVCAVYIVSLKRGLKYSYLSAKMLHIRNIYEETIYSGEIVDKNMEYEHPIYPPNYEEEEKERLARVEEAQKYSDEELDMPGLFEGNFINVNLMDYMDIPFQTGVYEIYLSFSGLESNRVEVEIVFK